MMMYWWVIGLGLLAIGVLFYATKDDDSFRKTGKKPIDVVKDRFAKGEISKVEYEEQKQIINSKN